ncbi:MAG: hypothetical protein J0M12_01395 [Deltaproteobacteria bacterium]|nr:hypothetical protein [Deltaproteobacteria bacterium]
MRHRPVCVAVLPPLLALLASLCFHQKYAQAQESAQLYVNPQFKFELRYPPALVPVESHNATAPLLLRTGGSNYPTFNVIVEPQTLNPSELTLAGQTERVLSAYRQLGMTDVELLSSRELELHGRAAKQIVLRYGSEPNSYTSAVTLLPADNFLYTLTFIEKSAAFAGSKNILDSMLASFQSSDGDPARQVPGQLNSASLMVYFSFGLLAFLIALAFLKRRR